MTLIVFPCTLKQANELVSDLHRHHKPAQGHRFSLGVKDGNGVIHGAAIVGRPVARKIPQYEVCEVVRLVTDGTKNACSMLYSAAARAAREMGYRKIQTYILESEPGTSLKASGWHQTAITTGDNWSRPSRQRNTIRLGKKQRWEKVLKKEGE
jgi:hypothetical protein